jgi:cytidylate kinase
MPRRVVCISSADGSGAEEAAGIVASRCGFRLIDEGIVLQAASAARVDPQLMRDVERRRSILLRLLEGWAATSDATAYALSGMPPVPSDEPSSDELRELIRTAIKEIAAEGDVVIVAHAASLALAGREDALRVLVTASPETRRRRYADMRSLGEKEAAKAIEESDASRAHYLKRFYGVQAELPTHYDLVINTDRLTPEQAAELVLQAVAAPLATETATV